MALSDRPAERHRQVAGLFTERACATRSWDAPTPVPGWAARDVVRHLTEWFPAFLAAGTGIELPRGPSADENPVTGFEKTTITLIVVLVGSGASVESATDGRAVS